MNLLLDQNNDLVISTGNLALTDSSNELLQRITTTLGTFEGEWWLNPSLGLPYFSSIFGKQPDLGQIQAIFMQAIINVPGVVELTTFEVDYDQSERNYKINFTATGSNGATAQGTISV